MISFSEIFLSGKSERKKWKDIMKFCSLRRYNNGRLNTKQLFHARKGRECYTAILGNTVGVVITRQ